MKSLKELNDGSGVPHKKYCGQCYYGEQGWSLLRLYYSISPTVILILKKRNSENFVLSFWKIGTNKYDHFLNWFVYRKLNNYTSNNKRGLL